LLLDVTALLLDSKSVIRSADVDDFVRSLQNLFSGRPPVSEEEIMGLWGELFVLANCHNPEIAIPAWHNTLNQKFDFARGADRVEVKTTSGRREHSFSIEQLRPKEPIQGSVISIVTWRNQGPSIIDLLDGVRRLAPSVEESARVGELAMKTLGISWREGKTASFDAEEAMSRLLCFRTDDIPCVGDIPPEVSGLRFTVDLTDTPPCSTESLSSELARALLPSF
jgi:hypothetical protein